MNLQFLEFYDGIRKNVIQILNKKLNMIIGNYDFINVTNEINFGENKQIFKNIKESKIILVNQIEQYFIIGFKKTIILIEQSTLNYLKNLLLFKEELKIIFLSNSKETFDSFIHFPYTESIFDFFLISKTFEEEFEIINGPKKDWIYKIWQVIRPCISNYLLKQCYIKSKKDRLKELLIDTENQQKNEIKTHEIKKEDYVFISTIGVGSVFQVDLIYLIEEDIFIARKWPLVNDIKNQSLFQREKDNYCQNINFPLLPKFYGIVKDEYKSLAIEYIAGKTLNYIFYDDQLLLNDDEKITIIFELLLIIEYLHQSGFCFRDLKPNNVIINENKAVVLIDFDRMLKSNEEFKIEHTVDFSSVFAAPEINEGKNTEKCDIYSLGMMIYYIMTSKMPTKGNREKYQISEQYQKIKEIYEICTSDDPEKRPTAIQITFDFYINFHSQIQIENLTEYFEKYFSKIYDKDVIQAINTYIIDPNNAEALFKLGEIYKDGQYVVQDLNKAISFYLNAADNNHQDAIYSLNYLLSQNDNDMSTYYSLEAKYNHAEAQYQMGVFYLNGKNVRKNINKAINFFSLAANQNHIKSQIKLGDIYEQGNGIKRDINKAIYYYTLAANQNDLESQLKLASIYYDDDVDIKRDVNKAIYYYELAAKQNDPSSLMVLGYIYDVGDQVPRDIKKAIYYYELASALDESGAQFFLGKIYHDGIYVTKNINKALHYYTLAAEGGDSEALYNLGNLYYEGKYVDFNFQKSLYYLSLAADKKECQALYKLGLIYEEGKYIERNIYKAIHYYSLAANEDYLDAFIKLGDIYSGSYGVYNEDNAICYYSIAADKKNAEAQTKLGLFYLPEDLNKSFYYLKQAADNNDAESQCLVGNFFYEGVIVRDVDRAIQYFSRSADQNYPEAQFFLAILYYEGNYVKKDMKKCIDYLVLSSNQHYVNASNLLGVIYYEGKFNKPDKSKAIHYFELAARQNDPTAQYYLALIYLEVFNYDKALHFFTRSAVQKYSDSQLCLGYFYFDNDIKRSIYWFNESSENNNRKANFIVGFFNHEGKYVKRDIQKAIYLYKEASSFNNHYAKNNLGVIYKNGFGVKKNIGAAIEYFKEAIHLKNDKISMFNLANIYIYELNSEESFELLVKSSELGFFASKRLLSIALIKKYGLDYAKMTQEISKYSDNANKLIQDLIEIVNLLHLYYDTNLECDYQICRNMSFIYGINNDVKTEYEITHPQVEQDNKESKNKKEISSLFYEGFGNL